MRSSQRVPGKTLQPAWPPNSGCQFVGTNKRWTSGIHGEVFALDFNASNVSYSGYTDVYFQDAGK
jgi:hypothetical protein